MSSETLFIMKDISKNFPGVKALDNVTFEVDRGEVHALVGENGAGKSTLIKILSGVYHQDSGQILYKGAEIDIKNPSYARELGISTIYQELNLCPNLTVADNIFLGNEFSSTFVNYIDEKKLNKECKKYLDLLEADVNSRSLVSSLSVAQQQMVEIAKALSYESEVIIMDEPTATLTLHETKKLFETIRKLKEQGRSVIYISHRLEEVFEIADTLTVLKDGKLVGTKPLKDLEYIDIVRMMVGRDIESKYMKTGGKKEKKVGKVLLEVRNLTKKGVFENINFSLHASEILGFSGLVGAGRTDLMRAIFGLETIDDGNIIINGNDIKQFKGPKEAINKGIGMTSEDRKRESLFLNFNIRENVTISYLDYLSKSGYIMGSMEKKFVAQFIKQLNIKPQNIEAQVMTMSGGNQQKVAIAKWLATSPEILIMDEPTRGIDVGAKSEIYKLIRFLAEQGKGIIFISSELPEILTLSDRIMVMNKGKIVGQFLNEEATEEKIMELAV
jgi:ABC-type sugar transport system ATPase subunit